MAKESVKARQRKREKMVEKFAEKRAALKAAGDWQALDQLPKNSSKFFGLSRVTFRDMALSGKIPGVTKASW